MTSGSLFDRALATAPGGVHSPVRAFRSVGGTPVFFTSASGPHLTDVDGRRYIDFCLSFGPLLLGHRDPAVAAAVHDAVDDGWTYGACEPYSLELAEWMLARLPWVERLRFVSSGTEAVMSALRVARAATGRARVLKFDGCYHGHVDALLVRAGSGLAGRMAASSAGIPDEVIQQTIAVPLDDESAVDQAFEAAGPEIAAVIVEPVPANFGLLAPRREWLQHVAACAHRAGALLVLDEVITGFRSGPSGAAPLFGVQPDLVCYGKAIGGGFPVAAYGGREDLMRLVAPSGSVYQAGTLSANPVGMRAGLATLRQMDARDGWTSLERQTSRFVLSLSRRLREAGTCWDLVQHASIFWFRLRGAEPLRRPDRIDPEQPARFARLFHAALARGVYLPPSTYEVCFLSMAHDDATLASAADALMAAAVESTA